MGSTDYALAAPAGYRAKMLVLAGPEETGPFRRNIVVSHEAVAAGTTADAHVAAQLAVFQKNMAGFKLVKRGSIEIGGQSCPLIEAQAMGPGGMLYGQLIAYFVRGEDAWALSGTHVFGPPFESARAEYAAVFRSFSP